MVEELSEFSAGQFETVSQLLASSVSLQMALAVLVIGLSHNSDCIPQVF